MSDPRDVETALDAKTDAPADTTDDGGADSSSSDQILDEARDGELRQAPAAYAKAVTQAAGDADSSSGSGGPTLDPPDVAGLDAHPDASAAFEDWRAAAAAPALGVAGGLGGLPDTGAQLGGLAGGSAFHSPGRPDLGISRDPGSLLGGRTSSDAALNQAAQAARDSGPQVGGSGGMSDYASGDTVTFMPVVTRDSYGNVTTETTTNTYGETGGNPGSLFSRGSDYGLVDSTTTTTHSFEPPADPPADEPDGTPAPAPDGGGTDDDDSGTDDDDDGGMTTGEDGPISPHAQAALDFLGVPDATISRAGTAGPDYAPGDPGDGGVGPGAPGDDGGGYTDPNPDASGPIIRDPGTRNPTAGPDYGPGIPGGDGTGGLARVGAVGAVGPVGTTGQGGGAEAGGIGSSSFAMSADADEAGRTAGMATGKDPSASPDGGGLSAGMATGKDPSASPDGGGLSAGMATGKDPSASPDAAASTAGMATGRDPSTISGSEDEDLEDLEVQRRTVRGGDTEATTVSAAGAGDDFVGGSSGGPRSEPTLADDFSASIMGGLDTPAGMPDIRPGSSISIAGVGDAFAGDALVSEADHAIGDAGYDRAVGGGEAVGSWSTTDQPGTAGSPVTVRPGDAAASTAGMATGRDPSTISGSEDEDLEDLEVQRRTVRGGDTEATTVSAAGAGDDFVGGSSGGPRSEPTLADDFSASIMGGLDTPMEVSATTAAPAPSMDVTAMDVVAAAPVVVEAGLPLTEPAELKIVGSVAGDDATAGGFDLSAQEAAFDVAPDAIEAPPMDQPVLEQVDPGLAANEPPPDAPDMGMDGPLP